MPTIRINESLVFHTVAFDMLKITLRVYELAGVTRLKPYIEAARLAHGKDVWRRRPGRYRHTSPGQSSSLNALGDLGNLSHFRRSSSCVHVLWVTVSVGCPLQRRRRSTQRNSKHV